MYYIIKVFIMAFFLLKLIAPAAFGAETIDTAAGIRSLCEAENGTVKYVIPVRYGTFVRMSEAGEAEALNQIERDSLAGFFAACEGGDRRFLVERGYAATGASARFVIRYGRGLEGIDYVKMTEGAYKAALAAKAEDTAMTPAEEERFLEKMAFDAANIGDGFVRGYGDTRYEALYGEKNWQGCGLVSVKETHKAALDNDNAEAVEKVYSFKVCKDTVAKIGGPAADGSGGATMYARLR